MAILILDKESRQRVSDLKAYAKANEFSKEDLLAIVADPSTAAGNFSKFNWQSQGYRVVYTIEQHPKYKFKHISISLNEKLPPVSVATFLMQEFGFEKSLDDCVVYQEPNAINILEQIN